MSADELFVRACLWLALVPIVLLLAVMVAEVVRALGPRRRSLPGCDYFPPPPLREGSTRGQVKEMRGGGRRPARPPPPPAPP